MINNPVQGDGCCTANGRNTRIFVSEMYSLDERKKILACHIVIIVVTVVTLNVLTHNHVHRPLKGYREHTVINKIIPRCFLLRIGFLNVHTSEKKS